MVQATVRLQVDPRCVFSVAAALLVAGCGEAIEPTVPVPVVQMLLIAGQPVQYALVEWSFPAQIPTDGSPRPVDPSLVRLVLQDWPFALFMLWVVILVGCDVGLLLLIWIDPIYGLGALIFTLAVLLAFMMGWLPLPGDRKARTRRARR